MRVKTEAKREEILTAAVAEFSQRGFHDTTLADVAKRMGSSKATIYNYYQTKGELFGAVIAAAAMPAVAKLLETFEGPGTFADRIGAFARSYLILQTGKTAIALYRLFIAESELSRTTIRRFREDPNLQAWSRLTAIFGEEQRKGALDEGDPAEMVSQLRAILHGGLPMRLLFGESDGFTEEEIDRAADSAVRLFLRAYARR